jgi:hypothetical protein
MVVHRAVAATGTATGDRLPDALRLATAEVCGAAVILTGDRGWVGIDTRVELIGG